jgi:hypothetical protein
LRRVRSRRFGYFPWKENHPGAKLIIGSIDARPPRGVLEWAFKAKPGEVKDISFAWRLRWPKDKGVVMVSSG